MESIGIDFPVVCHQCTEHFCTKCPQHAISITALGSIEVSPTLCDLCGACEHLCPVGAIQIYNEVPHVCDLCGGDPRCVMACDMGAIEYDPGTRQKVSLAVVKQQTRKMSPPKKRYTYALAESRAIREDWCKDRRK